MMDKKRYCILREDGLVKSIGISVARKDISALCKAAAYTFIDFMFKDTRQQAVNRIANFIFSVFQMAVSNRFTLKNVSRYIKKDGMSGYKYYSFFKDKVFVQEENTRLNSKVDTDISVVMKTISEEIERFTVPCMIDKTADIFRTASVKLW